VNCSKLLISAGVAKIVYAQAYPDVVASQLLAEAGVALLAYATLESVRG
jgi:deoxycytidylate deaminase